ncbi:MAG: dTDP-4-dehydrorhamnose reductase [Armatimonadetes bacterium]|nr:dTDP-4-dehydrorhamnose reductase [Armatimonadota bacterium]
MKILVTGADGMLGKDLMAMLSRDPEVMGVNRSGMDITDLDKVKDMIARYKPVVVVHTAAFTDVDGCESKPWDALRTNAVGTRNVSLACMEVDAAMLYVSTDYVFSGAKAAPYTEWDTPDPINLYGQSKYAGEIAVKDHLRKFFIVRTSGLYGRHGKSFIQSILHAAHDKPELTVVNDQISLPTYSRDLADAISRLVKTKHYGTYHITNTHENFGISWHDWAALILRETGMANVRLTPITSAQLNRPARRPPYSALGNTFFYLRDFPTMRPCHEALTAFLKEVGLK